MEKTRYYKCLRNCIFNNRYWYGFANPSSILYKRLPGMPEPSHHFEEVQPVEEDEVAPPDRTSLLEEQLRSLTIRGIKEKILVEYNVDLGNPATKTIAIGKAIRTIEDETIPRISAGEMAGEVIRSKAGLLMKTVSKMSPDELEKTSINDLSRMILRDRGVDKSDDSDATRVSLFSFDAKFNEGE